MLYCMFNHQLYVLERYRIASFEVDTAFTGFNFRILFFKRGYMEVPTRIQRDVILLISYRDPTATRVIGGHFVLHINLGLWIQGRD